MGWNLGSILGTLGGGLGGFLLGGPWGAFSGAKLGNTIGQGSKGKWGIDELLASLPLAGAAGVPGLDKIPGLGGGGDPTNGGMGTFAGEVSSTGEKLGGGLRGILGGMGGWVKGHPLESLMIAGSIMNSRTGRKDSEAQREYVRLNSERRRRLNDAAIPAMQALKKMLAAGPYSRQAPGNLNEIFRQ